MREAGSASANTISVGISNVRAKYNEVWALCIKWIYKPVLSLEMGNEKREPNTKRRFGCDKRATRNSAHQSKVDNDDVGYLTFSSSSCITQYAVARCGFNWMHARESFNCIKDISSIICKYLSAFHLTFFTVCCARSLSLFLISVSFPLYKCHEHAETEDVDALIYTLYAHLRPHISFCTHLVRKLFAHYTVDSECD